MKKIVQVSVDEALIAEVKSATGQLTASKAFLRAAKSYVPFDEQIDQLSEFLRLEREKVSFLEQRLQAVDCACRQVLEITGQGGLKF